MQRGGSGSGNPALSEKVVSEYLTPTAAEARTMSVGGTAFKTLFLLLVLIAAGAYGWAATTTGTATDAAGGYGNTTVTLPAGIWLASLGALFVGIACSVNPRRAAVLGVVYAALEGYVLGAVSAAFDAQTEGIVGAAVVSTICVFIVALFLYLTRIIKPTAKLAFGVTVAIGGLCLLYFFVFILSIFDWSWLYSDQFRTMGIAVSLIAIVLAALSLTLDFGAIEGGVEAGAPKFMEWYLAFSLTVTLVWLYITILRLLAFVNRS
jgi:uncharacterized YccA/Bax inhibitor family protein